MKGNEEKSDHDLLVSLGKDMEWVKKSLSNHLAHHSALEVGLAIATLGAVLTALFALLLK